MAVLPEQEQLIDSWLASRQLPRDCPICGSEQREIDLAPSWSAAWRSPGRTERRARMITSPARVEITCLYCASVRVFDAATMGVR
jgi:hypothetical protein